MRNLLVTLILLTSVSISFAEFDTKGITIKTAHDKLDKKLYSEALSEYTHLAKQGDIDSQTFLSILYSHGVIYGMGPSEELNKAIPFQPELAIKWLKAAAERGAMDAEYQLGILYSKGKLGLKKNHKIAYKWFKRSANKGYPSALYNIGNIHREGRGDFKINYIKAIDYYKMSEDASNLLGGSHMKALYNIGHVYYSGGYGVKKSLEKAHHFFMKAGAAGLHKGFIGALAICKESPSIKPCR